jgi:alginate O-acetyltransferase complex protein AlgI
MLFNSFEFIGLLLVTILLYYSPFFKKNQPLLLVLSSVTFYAYGQTYLVFLLLFSVMLNAILSYQDVAIKIKA